MDRGGQSGAVRRRRSDEAVRLGEVAQRLMVEQISPRQSVFGAVADAWSDILPDELVEHCGIVDMAGGLLKVKVDSPAYMYELQLCGSELLDELRRRCPRARLTRIKFAVG